ncbi:hypothetical protein U3516DRAFT_469444, partial [Neocallimastix sp. 'constans']
MLGWKYFCLIYLLLLYQLQYVLAELQTCSNINITNCPDANDNSIINDYTNTNCLKDNFIYRIKDDSCVSRLISGVHIFASNSTEIDLTIKNRIINTHVQDYNIYICSNNGCIRSTGYIKINELFVMETEKPDNWDIVFKEYYSVSMDSITPLSYVGPNNNKIPSFGTDLYAKKEFNSFFFVNENVKNTIIIDTDTKKKATPLVNSNLNNFDLNKYYIYECQNGSCIKITGHNVVNISAMERMDIADIS